MNINWKEETMQSVRDRPPPVDEEIDNVIVRVPPASDMDDETFCKHFTLRHAGSLAGLKSLDQTHISPDIVDLYRKFHDRLHSIHPRSAMGHEHGR